MSLEKETGDLREQLRALGTMTAEAMPLAETALLLAAIAAPETDVAAYRARLTDLAGQVGQRHAVLLAEAADSAALRLSALRSILAEAECFTGDSETYDDPRNASLVAVLDRRRGLPITLAILYIHAAREKGWVTHGLNFPGHFLVRLDLGGERVIFDPFDGARQLDAADLRKILKSTQGQAAELSADYYAPADNRAILLRLQNNLKTRLIAAGDYAAAADLVGDMRLFAPDESRLWLEAGILAQRAGRLVEAEVALTAYQPLAADAETRRDVALMLQQIRRQMAEPSG